MDFDKFDLDSIMDMTVKQFLSFLKLSKCPIEVNMELQKDDGDIKLLKINLTDKNSLENLT